MCDLVFSCFLALDQGSQTRRPHVAHDTRVFCVARNAFCKFSKNLHLCCLIYSPVFKSAQLASEQVPNERTKARNDLLVTHFLLQNRLSFSHFTESL